MKKTSTSRNGRVFGFFSVVIVGILSFGQIPTHAATDSARVVKYAQNDIVPVKAKLRFSTLIILPEKEEILDFTTGDKEFWIIKGAFPLPGSTNRSKGQRARPKWPKRIEAPGHGCGSFPFFISSPPGPVYTNPQNEGAKHVST